jgi:hypothetical protein
MEQTGTQPLAEEQEVVLYQKEIKRRGKKKADAVQLSMLPQPEPIVEVVKIIPFNPDDWTHINYKVSNLKSVATYLKYIEEGDYFSCDVGISPSQVNDEIARLAPELVGKFPIMPYGRVLSLRQRMGKEELEQITLPEPEKKKRNKNEPVPSEGLGEGVSESDNHETESIPAIRAE